MASSASPQVRISKANNPKASLKPDFTATTRSPSKRKRNDSVSTTLAELQHTFQASPQTPARKHESLLTSRKAERDVTPDSSDDEDERPAPSTPKGRNLSVEPESSVSGAASPRTVVARRLEDLDLVSDKIALIQTPRSKKAKVIENNELADRSEDASLHPLPRRKLDFSPEAGDKCDGNEPGKAMTVPTFSHMVIPDTPDVESFETKDATKETQMTDINSGQGLSVPSTPFTFTSPQMLPNRAVSPLPGSEESQFWSLSEITGHNPTDPDDDMTGINGVGFKPTPAMAAVRATKRKQQIDGWRKREAEDSRRKRAEIRSGSLLKSKMRREEAKAASSAVQSATAVDGESCESEPKKEMSPESMARRTVRFAA